MPTRERLVTPRFLLVVVAGFCYFVGLDSLTPVVPRYVDGPLRGNDVAVGLAVGALFFSAVVLRPVAGRIGDRSGRRILIVGGAAVVAFSTVGYGLVESLPFLVFARVVTGVGEAAFFVGAATMITDLAPESRRGEAMSIWSVAVYSGFAFGPALGEAMSDGGHYDRAWIVAGLLAAVAALLGMFVRDVAKLDARAERQPLLNRNALLPGLVLMLGVVSLAGFAEFVPLYVDQLRDLDARTIFFLFGGLVLIVRTVGARIPDTLGSRRAASLALTLVALGMGVMSAWESVAGLLLGTAIFALGMSFLYPALMVLALSGTTDTERGSVVGTVSSCFDLAQALGAPLLGVVAALTNYRGAFAAGGIIALVSLALLRRSGRDAGGVTPDISAIGPEELV